MPIAVLHGDPRMYLYAAYGSGRAEADARRRAVSQKQAFDAEQSELDRRARIAYALATADQKVGMEERDAQAYLDTVRDELLPRIEETDPDTAPQVKSYLRSRTRGFPARVIAPHIQRLVDQSPYRVREERARKIAEDVRAAGVQQKQQEDQQKQQQTELANIDKIDVQIANEESQMEASQSWKDRNGGNIDNDRTLEQSRIMLGKLKAIRDKYTQRLGQPAPDPYAWEGAHAGTATTPQDQPGAPPVPTAVQPPPPAPAGTQAPPQAPVAAQGPPPPSPMALDDQQLAQTVGTDSLAQLGQKYGQEWAAKYIVRRSKGTEQSKSALVMILSLLQAGETLESIDRNYQIDADLLDDQDVNAVGVWLLNQGKVERK
ncbi:MAG: hypothetical protein V2A79_14960 [Planctomycetota bacterium]